MCIVRAKTALEGQACCEIRNTVRNFAGSGPETAARAEFGCCDAG